MAKRKSRKAKTSRMQFLKAFFTGKLPKKSKPKRRAKKRIAVDASKGRKQMPMRAASKTTLVDES